MLLALSSGQKLGLVAFAGAFIAFALASSFLLPRRNPDFPGRALGWFVTGTLVLFVAMIGAVVALAREEEVPHGGEAAAETHAADETQTTGGGETVTTEEETSEEGEQGGREPGGGGTTGETGEQAGSEQADGDAAAGEAVFASAGCGSCHTLEAAGSSGTVGPNLDESKPSFELAVDRVSNGKGAMPSFEDQLSEKQIRDVSAYVAKSAGQ